ncbi:MAG TPA: asparagine synthase (glutamine-hydrolyzing) [Pyrinomonadaceae bacterium]|nr:asparagine synthase (glutamine-hydrolyzing) [Pyrinomonadaceae bacterium]
MCGIAGIRNSFSTSQYEVPHMLEMIRHRGPDDSGHWKGRDWHIGMTRLAIIDCLHGRQPMRSADGRWVIVLNGEIYNFPSLRQRLVDDGVQFRTRADTEVLLELVARRGVVAALEAIEGMFAFAVADIETGDLWLARDRFGEKPLYVDRRDGGFAFCSELTPLVKARNCSRRPSGRGIAAILRHGHPWPGVTAFEGISELRPGRWLRRSAGGGEVEGIYWQPPDRIDEEAGSIEKCGQRLLELLDESVSERLVSDVPLGLFLSGGIDSSCVAASASTLRPGIEAITAGFEAAGYDERPLARLTASHLGIKLIEEQGANAPFSQELFDDLLRHYGQPFLDTSSVPTRAVSHAARRHFTVVLSGDGGDELLSGYLGHSRNVLLAKYGGGLPGAFVSNVFQSFLPDRGRWESLKRALVLNSSIPGGLLMHTMDGVFTDERLLSLFEGTAWEAETREHLDTSREWSRNLWQSVKDPNLALSLHLIHSSLPQDILAKVDRMSMAESLEVRAPFLDSKLAAYALSLPNHLKMKGRVGKYILRHALRGRLPQPVLEAPKRGFCLPVRDWLGERFWINLREELDFYKSDSAAELNTKSLEQLINDDEERCRQVNSYRALHRAFLVYGFLRWRRQYVETPEQEIYAAPVAVEA